MMFSPLSHRLDCRLTAEDIDVLANPKEFKQQLLALIAAARQRIYITALYLQDDEAGREVIDALLAAKSTNPALDIKVFVDYHRAQRGLIGEKQSLGNRQLYLDTHRAMPEAIQFFGVPVKVKELFGVLHLKGMVFDEVVLYSGASINNVYCHQESKYRLDRYHVLRAAKLADSLVSFLDTVFVNSGAATRLDHSGSPDAKQIKAQTRKIKQLAKAHPYLVNLTQGQVGDISVEPVIGFGKRGNRLNRRILQLIKDSKTKLVIFTPYFNFPASVTKEIRRALRRGVKVTVVVGDKTANDFFIPLDKPFSTIGIIPYAYEQMLRNFVKRKQRFVSNGQLSIRLWKEGDNSYHLKGIVADDSVHLLTGNNLNPRAWGLDIENGLVIRDPNQHLVVQWQLELAAILANTREISSAADIETTATYPEKVKRLWRRLHLSQIDRIIKRFL